MESLPEYKLSLITRHKYIPSLLERLLLDTNLMQSLNVIRLFGKLAQCVCFLQGTYKLLTNACP